ncbi:MAG: VIT1/CCC1 transporter family protein [Spirochaetales bacterium]|nr:VIT1/CCC1 transporter family protein [Spirochaetales bacterium]
MTIDDKTRKQLLIYQKNEITEYHIYSKLAKKIKEPENRKILEQIAQDELSHYHIWEKYTGQEVKPDIIKIWKYYLISSIFGITFGIRLMERGEENAQKSYRFYIEKIKEANSIFLEEEKHEEELLNLLDEELLRYTGSMVLGLNDALVELTGALAGFTLALKNTKLIALVGLVTGIAAALSMASSEYLSKKSEKTTQKPLKAAIYTGIAYIVTVFILICPYLIFSNYYLCLGVTITAAILIIFLFNYYISVARDLPFFKHFFEMACLSLGVAILSFFIGFFLRLFIGVDV